ncbi:hypothetical protein FRAHR75_1500006 [Frankia sp. Hr75.2]|nr:hypothetical protein FRAHR75_1500006 [Frankia sp. Hr75.2]
MITPRAITGGAGPVAVILIPPPRVIVMGVLVFPGVVVLLVTLVLAIVTAAHQTSPYPSDR